MSAATAGDGAVPTYPPDRHILRDLAFTTEMGATDAARGWMDVGPHLRDADGLVHAGAVATLSTRSAAGWPRSPRSRTGWRPPT